MRRIRHSDARPGRGWHKHGVTSKRVWLVFDRRLEVVVLDKQRWLHVATGTTRHDRPVWDIPGHTYGLDVVVVVLATWLAGADGLHRAPWPWPQERPARRTVQRWHAALLPHAGAWLQHARVQILDYVAPRHLEEVLPAGIPPPRGRTRGQEGALPARQLRDVTWIHHAVARALCIPLSRLLGVARWRWPSEPASTCSA